MSARFANNRSVFTYLIREYIHLECHSTQPSQKGLSGSKRIEDAFTSLHYDFLIKLVSYLLSITSFYYFVPISADRITQIRLSD